MAEQLTFDLPTLDPFGEDDFFVSPTNAMAVEMLNDTSAWPQNKLVLVGPDGSGKTHLAHIWAHKTNAAFIDANDLMAQNIETLAQTPVVVENIRAITDKPDAQTQLFHLHNLLHANQNPLLLTANTPPTRWKLGLADLQSRMSGTAVVTLSSPDDALLSMVMIKLFSDRQIDVQPNLIEYLLKRMDRSFTSAANIVDQLDRAALKERRAITLRFAATVLDNPAKSNA